MTNIDPNAVRFVIVDEEQDCWLTQSFGRAVTPTEAQKYYDMRDASVAFLKASRLLGRVTLRLQAVISVSTGNRWEPVPDPENYAVVYESGKIFPFPERYNGVLSRKGEPTHKWKEIDL